VFVDDGAVKDLRDDLSRAAVAIKPCNYFNFFFRTGA
jgi:hypothetical protein